MFQISVQEMQLKQPSEWSYLPYPAKQCWKFCVFPCSLHGEIRSSRTNFQQPASDEAKQQRMWCSLLAAWQQSLKPGCQGAQGCSALSDRGSGVRLPALPVQNSGSGLTALPRVFSSTSLKCTHTMKLCIPPPPAQGFCFFGGGGGCFSVPADVNKIARWHFNALQRDRSLLLPGSRGSHSFAFPEVV